MHIRRATTTIAALAVASLTAAGDECDYAKGNTCINPQTSASVPLPIPTLFPSSSPPSFVYAIDDLSHAEIISITGANKDVDVPSGSSNGPMQAVSWWLDFKNATANVTGTQERAYSAWALESNSTADVGGADGGCEGLLGKECVEDLKTLFSDKNTLQMGSTVGTGALMKYFAKPPANLRCPDVLWGDGSGKDMLGGTSNTRPLVANAQWIARISDKFAIGQEPIPGNASFTHGRTTMRFRSFDEQQKLAIIAFSVGYPSGGPGERDDNTLNMACLRIGKAEKGSSGSGKDPEDSGAGQLGPGLATVVTAIIMSLFTV